MKHLMENWRKFVTETKNEDGKEQGADGKACWKGYKHAGTDEDGKDKCVPMEEELDESDCDDEEKLEEKPAKGKKSSKTYTNPDTGRKNKVSYGQKGAKIAPGTDKGDSYCARSNGIKKGLSKDKQNDPNTPNNLSRKKWKCSGDKSMKENGEPYDREDLMQMIRDYSKELTGRRNNYGNPEKLSRMSLEQLQDYYQGMFDSPEAQYMADKVKDEEDRAMGQDNDYDRMPKQSGMSRIMREWRNAINKKL